MIHDYDFHPPDDVRLFPMPKAGVLQLDDDAFVAEVRYGEINVRHYAFGQHWFKINCTFDLEGRFVETSSPEDVPPFTFNCDIATPMLCRGEAVYAVDLFLDVLVRSDGITHGVYDEEDFTHALERGWLSEREAEGARAGLRELVDLIESNALVDFLTDVHPIVPTLAPEAPAMERVSLGQVPLLGPRERPSW